jgi:hypothetical protein
VTSLRRLPTLIAFGLALLPALLQTAAAKEPVAIPGTTVTLAPPDGFTSSTQFSGFENKETGASVLIVEFPPEAYDQISTGLFGSLDQARTEFAKRQIKVETRSEVDTPNGKIVLLKGEQVANGETYEKWMALFKGGKTVMLTVQAPEDESLEDEQVVALVKSVTLGQPQSIAERTATLPYRIEAAEPFRVADILAGNTVLLVVGPQNVDPSGNMPLLLVSPQLSGGPIGDKVEAAAEALLAGTVGLKEAKIEKRGPVTFAGAKGLAFEGSFEEKGLKKRFLQYLSVLPGGKFIRLFATAKADAFDGLKPAMEKTAASVVVKPAP